MTNNKKGESEVSMKKKRSCPQTMIMDKKKKKRRYFKIAIMRFYFLQNSELLYSNIMKKNEILTYIGLGILFDYVNN